MITNNNVNNTEKRAFDLNSTIMGCRMHSINVVFLYIGLYWKQDKTEV